MSCLWCATYYFNQGFPLPWQTKRTSFQGLSFSDRYCKQKLQDVLLLYNNLIGINVIIIIIIIRQDVLLLYNNLIGINVIIIIIIIIFAFSTSFEKILWNRCNLT